MRVVIRVRLVEVRRPRLLPKAGTFSTFHFFMLGMTALLCLIPAICYLCSTEPLTASFQTMVLSSEAMLVMGLLIGKLWLKHLRFEKRQAATLSMALRSGVL